MTNFRLVNSARGRGFLKSLALLLILFPTSGAGAEETLFTVETDGIATISGDNAARARADCLDDALKEAVEQAVSMLVSSEMIEQNRSLLNERIYSVSQTYVQHFKVTSEKRIGNIYQLTTNVTVSSQRLKNDLGKLGFINGEINLPSVLLIIAERRLGETHFSCRWSERDRNHAGLTEAILAEKLKNRGFPPVDGAKYFDREISLSSCETLPSEHELADIGKRLDAQVVVYGSATLNIDGKRENGILADLNLAAVQTDSGLLLASSGKRSGRYEGLDPDSEKSALMNMLEQTGGDFINQIIGGWNENKPMVSTVHVSVTGVRSYPDFVKLTDLLENGIKGVLNVYQRGFSAGSANLDIEIKGTSQMMADQLTMISYDGFLVDILEISDDRLTIHMRSEDIDPND